MHKKNMRFSLETLIVFSENNRKKNVNFYRKKRKKRSKK